MLYNYFFDMAAVALTLALLMICWMRRSYPTTEARLFYAVVICNGIACLADIGTAFTISYPTLVPLWANYIVNIIYLAGNVLTGVFYLHYVLQITGIGERLPLAKTLLNVFFVAVAFGIFTTPVTHLVFYFDSSCAYLHGVLFTALYIFTLVCMGACAACLLSSLRKLSAYQVFPPVATICTVFIAMCIQAAKPYYLIEGFSITVMLVLTYSVMEANSKYMHKGSYCYNYLAFRDSFDKAAAKKGFFSVVAFGFDDMTYTRNAMDLFSVQELMLKVADALLVEFEQKKVFYLRDCRFAVLCPVDKEDEVIKRIAETLGLAHARGNIEIRLEPCFCVLRHPGLVESGCDADDVIVYALQHREEKGGERVLRVNGSSYAEKRREGVVIRAMREAILHDGFTVHLQPIRNARTGRYDSAEALVRLPNDELGVVGPAEFIPLAESNGMIGQISDQVFEKVCRIWSENNLRSRGVSCIEVNLSAAQLLERGLSGKILSVMSRYGVEPDNINLEITETALLALDERAMEELEALHDAGIKFSLDDYGSGYASAVNLYTLPLSMVKIDKTLIHDAMKKPDALMVLSAFVELCAKMEKEIVAEGVETPEMEALVQSLGIQHLQGYLYSRPIEVEHYLAFLENNARA